MTANNVERDANEVRLRGNVQIQLRPQSPNAAVMVLYADEAIYRLKTDEIVPGGKVRLTIEKPK
jgi:lipopolysaccharide assembly outer membrane protein LptD (OstA)